jgi:secondary thiamine-phosphate synthase enzyme
LIICGMMVAVASTDMPVHQTLLTVATSGAGPYEITDRVGEAVRGFGVRSGIVSVFCSHTSCSLLICENADPSARADLEDWLRRLVRDDDPNFTHTAEGPDDMPAHIKTALLRTSETVPIVEGRMALGTWQGLFLWEHRSLPHRRELLVTVVG